MRYYGNNPAFLKIVQNMVTKTIEGAGHVEGIQVVDTEQNMGITGTDQNKMHKRNIIRNTQQSPILNKIKSPSDTTIYAPGLKRVNTNNRHDNVNLIDRILNFVENVRLETTGTPRRHVIDTGLRQQIPDVQQPQPGPSGETRRNFQPPSFDEAAEARSHADKLILDAERFKASVNAPQGTSIPYINNNQNHINQFEAEGGVGFPRSQCMPVVDCDDDDFFHLTCHIEPNLRCKIEWGSSWTLKNCCPERNCHTDWGMTTKWRW